MVRKVDSSLQSMREIYAANLLDSFTTILKVVPGKSLLEFRDCESRDTPGHFLNPPSHELVRIVEPTK